MVEALSKSWCKKSTETTSQETTITTSKFRMVVTDRIEYVMTDWDALVDSSDLMFSSNYLGIIEKNPPQDIKPYYVVAYDKDKPLAAFYFQYKFVRLKDNLRASDSHLEKFSFKQFVKDQCIKSINFPTLVCGNLMITGPYGFRIDSKIALPTQKVLLSNAIESIINKLNNDKINTGLVIIKDFEHYKNIENFGLDDYTQFFVQPNMSMEIKPQWTSMEMYLFDLKSKYRVRYRKALQTTSHLTKKELTAEEILNNQESIFNLYKKISDQAKFNSFVLDKSYFFSLKKKLGDHLKLISYWDGEKLIGFYTAIQHEYFLGAHFLGYDTGIHRETHLYLAMLYDMVDNAIKMKCKKINLSRTAIEIKSTIGAAPQDMYILMRHTNKLLNLSVSKIADWVNPTEKYVIRNPFKD